jgi:hypothetical protein
LHGQYDSQYDIHFSSFNTLFKIQPLAASQNN